MFAFAPEAAAILGFFFLLLFDRPYLQSETFQLRKMEIEMIEQKGIAPIDATTVEAISDPDAPLLLKDAGADVE